MFHYARGPGPPSFYKTKAMRPHLQALSEQIFVTSNFDNWHICSPKNCNDVLYLFGKPWSTLIWILLVKNIAVFLRYSFHCQSNPIFIVLMY